MCILMLGEQHPTAAHRLQSSIGLGACSVNRELKYKVAFSNTFQNRGNNPNFLIA